MIKEKEIITVKNKILNFKYAVSLKETVKKGNGVRKLNSTQKLRFIKKFNKYIPQYTVCDFIPASGSGSRMYKDLIAFTKEYNPDETTFSTYVNSTKRYGLHAFFTGLKNHPIYAHLKKELKKQSIANGTTKLAIAKEVIQNLKIQELPKGLQPFHSYDSKVVNAFEEQCNIHNKLFKKNKKSQLHFTINKNYEKDFNDIVEKNNLKEISFSDQDKKSDTFCVNIKNKFVKTKDGYFKRPSGHGALLPNLNTIDSQLIYIHNIDNVPHQNHHKKIIKSRKLLIGNLIYAVKNVHRFLRKLEEGELSKRNYKKLSRFLLKYFHIDSKEIFKNSEEGFNSTIYHLLNRPIRVCGMIENKEHEGGGPFWVTSKKYGRTLQIVEAIEIDTSVEKHQKLIRKSTYFNPVEIACYVEDYKGNNFNLEDFVNCYRSLPVEKEMNGEKIRFLEKPGLWNGSMHDWLTMFIEMNSENFNPVKSTIDLLSDNHQG